MLSASEAITSTRSLQSFPKLHTEVSRSWARPFTAHIFLPTSDYFGDVLGLNDCSYRVMPRVEKMLWSYLSPEAASSRKFAYLPSKPLRTTSALVGKEYMAAGQVGLQACGTLCRCYRHTRLICLRTMSSDDIWSSGEPLIWLPRRPSALLGYLWQLWWQQRDIYG